MKEKNVKNALTSSFYLFNGFFNIKNYINNKKYRTYALKHGIIIDERISITPIIEEILNNFIEKKHDVNSTFYTSWSHIENLKEEEIIINQLTHYITTYSDNLENYYPDTKLKKIKINYKKDFMYIRLLDKKYIKEHILKLSSGLALKRETVNNIFELIQFFKYDKSILSEIKNRELSYLLYNFYDIFPDNIEESFKYLIYKLTGETLIIKNNEMIRKIYNTDENNIKYIDRYIKTVNMQDFSSIFFKYRVLILALKKISENKTYFNTLRKMADKFKKRTNIPYIKTITGRIKNKTFDYNEFHNRLNTIKILDKIKLLNALLIRVSNTKNIVYQVRNGKSWVEDFNSNRTTKKEYLKVIQILKKSIKNDLQNRFKGKKFYIPSNIKYAIPTSEKQFIGNIPFNTRISLDKNMIVGITWHNVYNKRIDLDLSLVLKSVKIGWDGTFKNNNAILHSGDIVDGVNGATESILIKNISENDIGLININHFTYHKISDIEKNTLVPYRFFIAKWDNKLLTPNYTVNPNNIIFSTDENIITPNDILGIIYNNDNKLNILLNKFSSSKNITASNSIVSIKNRKFLLKKANNMFTFNELIELCGGKILHKRNNKGDYIDLSINNLKKESLIEYIIKD